MENKTNNRIVFRNIGHKPVLIRHTGQKAEAVILPDSMVTIGIEREDVWLGINLDNGTLVFDTGKKS